MASRIELFLFMKPETIDETCKQPEGSFQKFIEGKERHLRTLEERRKLQHRRTTLLCAAMAFAMSGAHLPSRRD